MTVPRPAAAVAAAATAISAGHSGPGSADQAARAPRPADSAARNVSPAGYRAQDPAAGTSGPAAAGGDGLASVPACRGGTASRSTSARVPAYRSATARASPAISGVSTGSGDTTRSR